MIQASLPSGTRDFASDVLRKRQYIISVLRLLFEQFGFQPLETPSFENIQTLTGKYGEEGDTLLFKILNSRIHESNKKEQMQIEFNKMLSQAYTSNIITERALRYDLTIPLARYAAMNREKLSLPFKRYQIQPVWRADKPQKGRYREFYQCDCDIIGSVSLLNEIELIQIFQGAFEKLKLPITISLNNRKVLQGITEKCGCNNYFKEITIAIDKLDKIGYEGVSKELSKTIKETNQTEKLLDLINLTGDNTIILNKLTHKLAGNTLGTEGISELRYVLEHLPSKENIEIDLTLARGLDYYTGCILEVKAKNFDYGSIGGGGRYDDLASIFGWKGISGVGISFGLDRIYDVMNALGLLQNHSDQPADILITYMKESLHYSIQLANKLRSIGLRVYVFPDDKKLGKQIEYADKKNIPYIVVVGATELHNNSITLKNLITGKQIAINHSFLNNTITKIKKIKISAFIKKIWVTDENAIR